MAEQATGANDARRNLERHIGQTVRKLRRQQNLTIAEIARKAHISSGMLSKIENSQTSASLDSLASLADALGTTLASLFTGFSSEEGGAQHVKSGHAPEVVRRGTKRGHTYHLLAIERGPRDRDVIPSSREDRHVRVAMRSPDHSPPVAGDVRTHWRTRWRTPDFPHRGGRRCVRTTGRARRSRWPRR